MRWLLFVTAIIEALAGEGLLLAPAIVARLLVAASVPDAVVPLLRVCGAALLGLGVACWLVHGEAQGRSARPLVLAMLVYNLGAVIVLAVAGVQAQPTGVALWPAVIVHTAMAAWCIAALLAKPT
jgi:hypothetical protein